jgi:hypothetical protein
MAESPSGTPLSDPARLRALESIGLMGTDGETEFDRISALAARCLAAPVGLVSLVGEDCQVFVGVAGLITTRCTPLSHTLPLRPHW